MSVLRTTWANCGLLLAAVGLLAACTETDTPVTATCDTAESQSRIIIGALVATAAEEEAVKYGLQRLKDMIGESPDVELIVKYTDEDPSKALTAFEEMATSCVQVIVGPDTSASLQRIMVRAEMDHITIISPSSTAEVLRIPDHILRLAPMDSAQIAAVNAYLKQERMTSFQLIYRYDSWGLGIYQLLEFSPTSLLSAHAYDPDVDTFEYMLAEANANVSESASNHTVILAGFSEVSDILMEAAEGDYPNLATARWMTLDGYVGNAHIFSDTYAAAKRYALDHGFISTGPYVDAASEAVFTACEDALNAQTVKDIGFYELAYTSGVVLAGHAIHQLQQSGYDRWADDWSRVMNTQLVASGTKNEYCIGPILLNDDGDNTHTTIRLYSLGATVWSLVP